MNLDLLAAAGVLAIAYGAIVLVERRVREGGREQKAQGARWARRRDLRALRVKGPEPGRLALGRQGRRLLAAERGASVIVFAPTQSFKTTGLVIPALLEWQGPVLATSVKSDLLRDTLARRRALGEAMVFDPLGATGEGTMRATPLSGCGTWGGSLRVAHWLASSAQRADRGLSDAGFWYAAAEKLIAPLLFAAASTGGTMKDVIRWLNEGIGCQMDVTVRLGEADDEYAESAWKANLGRDERQMSSIYTTAETILAAFADPDVLEASCDPNYTAASLLDGSAKTLYLCAPDDEQERLASLFAMMITEVVSVVKASAAASGKPLDPPLLLALDEAANIAPVPGLAKLASTGAGQGIQLLSVFQDANQVYSVYGDEAESVINNHRGKIFGAGLGDRKTLSYIREVTGSGEFRQVSQSAGEGRSSATTSSAYRDLAPPHVMREMKPGKAGLVYGHLPAARIALRRWFADPGLQELAKGNP